MVRHAISQTYEEPTTNEQDRAMGFLINTIATYDLVDNVAFF